MRAALVRDAPLTADQRRHLAGCDACADVARRREEVRRALTDHRAVVEPDAGFSQRVVARLAARDEPIHDEPFEMIAWASLRCLPAGAALALVLGLWVALLPPTDVGPAPLSDEAVILWLLQAELGAATERPADAPRGVRP